MKSPEELDAQQNAQQTSQSFEETFDTMGLILDYLVHWKWFVGCVIVALICVYYYLATIIPVYSVSASIFLSDETNNVQNAISMNSPLVEAKDYIDETELEMLKSRNNVVKIVDSLNLAYSYYRVGSLRNTPLYRNNAIVAHMDSASLHSLRSVINAEVKKGSKEGKYDVKVKTTVRGVKEEKNFEDVALPLDVELSSGTLTLSKSPIISKLEGTERIVINAPYRVAGAIAGSLNIEYRRNSFKIIRITCRNTLIDRGIDIVNALIDFYNRDIIEDKNRAAVQTEAFILDRLVLINGELKDVENRLQNYRQAHNITNIDMQASMNLSLKSGLETQLAELDTEASILQEIENLISTADLYQTLPTVVNEQGVSSSIEAYNRRVSQFIRTREGLSEDNPLVISMKEELNRDKSRILGDLAAAKRSLAARRNMVTSLENKSAGQLASVPPIDKGLQEIFREQQVKVNVYTFLLQKREEIALQKTLATNTARLIDNPVGSGPVAPKRNMYYGAAFLLGLLIPALVIFLRRMIFPVFNDQEELERLTKLPIIGEICKAPVDNDKEIVVAENVATPIAELFRLLRNNIGFTTNGKDKRVILVTSSISGEGKTFVAVNLAMTYALTGKKVVVVGMDIRRPTMARRLGLNNQYGVTTFLSGQEKDINKLIKQSNENPNLYVLPAGPIAPNPNELILSTNMDDMIEQLRRDFDYVIIDSAPIGIVSDTYLILRHSDIQIFVTRAGYSTKRCLKVLHQAYDLNKFSKVYILLNGVNMKSGSYLYRRYGQYSTYGYHRSKGMTYGYGYDAQKKHHGKGKKNNENEE